MSLQGVRKNKVGVLTQFWRILLARTVVARGFPFREDLVEEALFLLELFFFSSSPVTEKQRSAECFFFELDPLDYPLMAGWTSPPGRPVDQGRSTCEAVSADLRPDETSFFPGVRKGGVSCQRK